MTPAPHVPVLLAEVLAALAVRAGGVYVDGTFGAGGYTRAILEAADCTVVAIDRDPEAQVRAEPLRQAFPGRFTLLSGRFGDMATLLPAHGFTAPVDGVALDIGVSSMQIDEAERGFSFAKDGPLDMRMEKAGRSAADVVNEADEAELADIIHFYGEERYARRVARAIVEARAEKPFERTLELAEVVRRVVRKGKDGIDPATRTFQGLRIAVNDELGELERGLAGAEAILAPGGRLAVVTFHSLEDRVAKRFIRERSGRTGGVSRHVPVDVAASGPAPTFHDVSRKAIAPGPEECRANPRARSAKLRVAERTDAPAPSADGAKA
ncbi:16S rRNA (cytosine(1402)-N(4))-methyltransferase RsmH [Caenispirillum bisanense]|uniref:Ribosomal RNA small subunit methyltransferase H n=1 Tax=Caenispirillum bisanense TaxID=414052 RepID=A0A286G4Z0_9PROT|nr:16S rRNA (cytosine(1402)-N(4))-methyltransferase RsmH [Caenispirillum bisanense]SOD90568.1 16S rRNA (cytosine1402-N4)-methyltransferase [Caenispirillum bisanense]